MPPIEFNRDNTVRQTYAAPFIGRFDQTLGIQTQASRFTNVEVDANGYLKPGVLLRRDGYMPDGTVGEFVYGAVVAPVKVARGNTAGDLAAGALVDVAVAMFVLVQRDVVEDMLGRVYTPAEVAASQAAGSHVALTRY